MTRRRRTTTHGRSRRAAALVVAIGAIALVGCGSGSQPRARTSTTPGASSSGTPGVSTGATTTTRSAVTTGASTSSSTRATTTSRPPTTESATTGTSAPTTSTPTTASPTTRTVAPTTQALAAPTTQATAAGHGVAAAPTSSSGSDVPWGWVALGAGIVVVVAGLLVARHQRHRRRAAEAWRAATATALDRARVTRDVLDTGGVADPRTSRGLEAQVEEVAGRLDALATSAPTDDDRRATATTADALRAFYFALEAERLLHDGRTPTGEQLARASQSRREGSAALDRALERLESRVGPRRSPSARV